MQCDGQPTGQTAMRDDGTGQRGLSRDELVAGAKWTRDVGRGQDGVLTN